MSLVRFGPHRVVEKVAEIAAMSGLDDEAAHSLEDALYREVLEAIADGHPDSAALAAEALRTKGIEFCRWYA